MSCLCWLVFALNCNYAKPMVACSEITKDSVAGLGKCSAVMFKCAGFEVNGLQHGKPLDWPLWEYWSNIWRQWICRGLVSFLERIPSSWFLSASSVRVKQFKTSVLEPCTFLLMSITSSFLLLSFPSLLSSAVSHFIWRPLVFLLCFCLLFSLFSLLCTIKRLFGFHSLHSAFPHTTFISLPATFLLCKISSAVKWMLNCQKLQFLK